LLVQGVAGTAEVGGAPVGAALDGVRARWGLSAAQADAAGEALRFMDRPGGGKFLLWAVTGAGKTEMMFPLVERTVAAGGRALVATPRKDVVLELMPRVKAAFPSARVVTLYGGSEERWDFGTITIATTHQLFRFREAFDLVVLDEIDAFPYHGDPQLAYAAEGACRPGGKFVLLSATPPAALRSAASRGVLPYAKVCVRFHGKPLPVPRRLAVPPLRRWADGALPRPLREAAERSLRRDAQLFVFVPWIAAIDGVVRLLRGAFPDVPIGGTSSKDEERGEKVLSFRERALRIIVTTTILERGVTVPRTDVFILDADSPLFDGASLVQMAGRAGRKAEDPSGNVYFCSADWTKGQKDAIRDIRSMNELARKRGYLVP
jgi:competence protein ComFA